MRWGGRRIGIAAAVVTGGALIAGVGALALHDGHARAVRTDARARGGAAAEVDLDPAAIAKLRRKIAREQRAEGGSRAKLVVAVPPGQGAGDEAVVAPAASGPGTRAESDADIETELAQFRTYLATIPPTTGKRAEVLTSGEAAAPFNAPRTVIEVVQAANEIARTPYRWGGGHSAWRDKGYDCSGSVSFALAAAGLLSSPLDSTSFMSYGASGPGHWITIYANHTHAFMTVAGLRFDTGGLRSGTRWQASMRPTGGFVARHPPGF